MLYTTDGRPRCAIVTTAHLSDEERQFVTSLVLSKLVTWMRRQSGTTDLRAMLYMDEVAGYLPPTANPPTKKPIMTLMKQARAFGVGVVLSTQNPVDIDYKALSQRRHVDDRTPVDRARQGAPAGRTDIGRRRGRHRRRSTTRSPASASVSSSSASPGKDATSVFTTRWAMSYLRGPMTRDQISRVAGDAGATGGLGDAARASAAATSTRRSASPARGSGTDRLGDDETTVMPEIADGVAVRFVDVAAPWLADVGGDAAGDRLQAAVVARVALRYDETKADLIHDEEYECVITPLDEQVESATGWRSTTTNAISATVHSPNGPCTG